MSSVFDMPMHERVEYYREKAQRLAEEAEALGVVLTATERPLLPLAMGNTTVQVEARLTRAVYTNSEPPHYYVLHDRLIKAAPRSAAAIAAAPNDWRCEKCGHHFCICEDE